MQKNLQYEIKRIEFKFIRSVFIKLIIFFAFFSFFLVLPIEVSAATYYVDATGGNDSANGTSDSTPWKTINKVNTSTFSPDDSILFKKGEVWREKLTAPSSGTSGHPITFGAYGSGANPIFDGSEVITGAWTQYITSDSYNSALSVTPNSGWTTGTNFNVRGSVPVNSSPVDGSKIRITVKASTGGGGGTIAAAAICAMTTGYDFDSSCTPTAITWNGGSASVTVADGATQISDEITFTFDKTQRYGIHFWMTNRRFVYQSSGGVSSGRDMYSIYQSVYSDLSTTKTLQVGQNNITTISSAANATPVLTLLEVYGGGSSTNAWYKIFDASATNSNVAVWDNGTPLIIQNPNGGETTTATVISTANHSYYDATNLWIHTSDNSSPNTNGRTYEATVRTETFLDNEKNYLIIDGIDQRRTAGNTGTIGGLKLTGTNNIVRNLSTYDHYRHGLCFYSTGAQGNSGSQNNTATNITAYNSFSTTPICIYQSGGKVVTSNTLSNSTIHNEIPTYGGSCIIDHGGAAGNTISNNTIYSCGQGTGTGLIYVTETGSSLRITRNYLYGTAYGGGIYLGTGATGTTADYNVIDASSFDHTYSLYTAIRLDGSTGNNIYNNTIVGTNSNPAISQRTNATGTTVKNNIVSGATSFTKVDSGSETSSTYNNNLVYNLAGNFGIWAGTTYTSFADWKTGSGQDANSVSSDPKFEDSTVANYHLLASSPAINAGEGVSLTQDKDGNSVPQGSAPDIGAYEFLLPSSSTSLGQYQSDGTSSISSGATLGNGSNVVFKFKMSSANSSDSLTPQIEIQRQGTAFTNTPTQTGTAVSYTGTAVDGTITVQSMGGGNYHWQARVSNSAGQSSWVSMGGDPDFSIEYPASSAPSCSDASPGVKAPWLYGAAAEDSGSIKLSFTKNDNPVEKYVLEYGTKSGSYQYGVDNMGVTPGDQMTFLVKSLTPNTTYHFRVRAGNGCATGTWSNEISARTKSLVSINQLKFTSSELNIVPTEIIKESVEEELTPEINNTVPQEGYDVKVKVLDDHKKPVEGATVTLHSNPQTAKTNKDGVAKFSHVESGDHKVLIVYNGFQGEQSINLTGDVKEFDLNVTIKPQNVLLSPVVIIVVAILVIVIIILGILLMRSRKTIKALAI